jgi:hypothetical protein
MSTQGGQSYVGLYLRRTDAGGDAGMVFFPQLDQGGVSRFEMQWGSLKGELPAGHYAAYLVADAPATLRIPIEPGGQADAPTITVHATRSVALGVHLQQSSVSLGQQSTSIRSAPAFDTATAGVVGAYFGSSSNLSGVHVSACLPRHGKACASADPQAHGSTGIAVGGFIGATIRVTPGRVTDARDQLASVSVPTATSGTLYLISIAVHLD